MPSSRAGDASRGHGRRRHNPSTRGAVCAATPPCQWVKSPGHGARLLRASHAVAKHEVAVFAASDRAGGLPGYSSTRPSATWQ
jgi:hypothetical protein